MTLTGAAARLRPDVDTLAKTPIVVVVHDARLGRSGAPATTLGLVNPGTGRYAADANRLTPAERREAGLRRNGQPRRKGRP